MYFPENMTFQYFFFDTYIGYILQILPIALAAGILYAVYKRKRQPQCSAGRIVGASLFVCYLTALVCLTIFIKLIGDCYYHLFYHRNSGMTHYWCIFEYYLIPDFFHHFSRENLGNVLLFLPFGVLYPLFRANSSWVRIVIAGIGTSAVIELIQPIFGRSFDINDIILNGIGVILSATVFCLLRRFVCGRR